jgi:hypothetical protein
VSLTDADLVRALAYVVLALLGGFATIAWWAARYVVGKIEGISAMFQRFDRRLTRVEARLGMVPSDDLFGEDTYTGPERRGVGD